MLMNTKHQLEEKTSWQHVSKWYKKLVSKEGHYYHQHLIIPGIKKLLNIKSGVSLLDLACGEGILGRNISGDVYYQGIDIAPTLIKSAKIYDKNPEHYYGFADITKPLSLEKSDFDFGTIILALQNVENPKAVLLNFQEHLKLNGEILIVINHPYFRIPRQTAWEIDEKNQIQYRRINCYLTPLKIPIVQKPSRELRSPITWSFHYPLSSYTSFLFETGFVIEKIEEWVSDKVSMGKAARMENRARMEFPLFMALLCRKVRITSVS